jgi:ubiquinone/menaquinone biosynthesis C-methylase UbiE
MPSSSAEAIAAAFDKRAPTYARNEWHRRSAEHLVSLCDVRPGNRVLDAGTGTGFAAVPAAARVAPGGHVLGVDLSAGMLREAEAAVDAAGGLNVELLQGDATALPHLSDQSFDVVICATALLYMPIERALREWHRLLASGGQVAFSTMHASFPVAARLFRDCAMQFGLALDDPCAPLGTAETCAEVLQSAGFAVARVDTGTISFSPSDLAEAWTANVNSPGHGAVKELSDAQRDDFRRIYLDTLARQPPGELAQSTMLYAIGRR